MGDLLRDAKKEHLLILGMGLTTACNGIATVIYAVFFSWLTDHDGSFDRAIVLSGGIVILAGILTSIISPLSNKFKVI